MTHANRQARAELLLRARPAAVLIALLALGTSGSDWGGAALQPTVPTAPPTSTEVATPESTSPPVATDTAVVILPSPTDSATPTSSTTPQPTEEQTITATAPQPSVTHTPSPTVAAPPPTANRPASPASEGARILEPRSGALLLIGAGGMAVLGAFGWLLWNRRRGNEG